MTAATPSRTTTLLKWIIPLLILAAAVFAFRYMSSTKPVAVAKVAKEKVWTVQTTEVQLTSAHPEVILYGQVEAPDQVTLSASVSAYVQKTSVRQGNSVKQGDLLLQLDPRDAQLQLDQKIADLRVIEAQIETEKLKQAADKDFLSHEKQLLILAERSVARYDALKKRQAGSDDQADSAQKALQQQRLSLITRQLSINDGPNRLQQLEAQHQKAKSAVEISQLDLQRTHIEAPFSGRITNMMVTQGDRVRVGDPLVKLYHDQTLEIRAQLPSRLLPSVRRHFNQGEPINAVATSAGEPIKLQLDRIAADISSGKAGVDLFFRIDPSDQQILESGRVVSLVLQLPLADNSFAAPPQALYGTDRVYLIKENTLQAVEVSQLGSTTLEDGSTQLLLQSDNLQPGQRILTTQLPNAISGLQVKEVEQP